MNELDEFVESSHSSDLEREIERLKDEREKLRRQLRQAHRDDDTAEKVREKIFEIAAISPEQPSWLYTPGEGGAPGVPMTLWSDWHFGEVVDPDAVGGVNEFDSEIAIRRADYLANKVVDICFEHMVNPQYPGIVVALGGDMMTGDLHEELSDTNDKYPLQQFTDLLDVLVRNLSLVADKFGKVFVPCVVGNHGRNTLKKRSKGIVFTSYEWLLYCMLERFFQNDARIQFLIPNETDAHFKIYGHRYMMTHGDNLGVKGGDGIIGALGPIMRGATKVGRAEAQVGRDFDTLIMGHWHQHYPLRTVIVNGSLKGYDEYARNWLRVPYEPPIQNLWFTHPENGITSHWPIFLEKRRSGTGEWTSWKE